MKEEANIRFLKMLGMEGEELTAFLPDWLDAVRFLHLTEKDVERAVDSWIPLYWDISLEGMRRFLAAYMKELAAISKIDEYKRRGDKIIYTNSTASHICSRAYRIAGGGHVHVFYPEFIITTALQAFFGKTSIAEVFGKSGGAECSHCVLNQNYVDLCIHGIIPFPTVNWNWGLHCNEGSKTNELISCLVPDNDAANVLLSLPHDVRSGVCEADDKDRVHYLVEEIRDNLERLREITGYEVTEDHLRQATEEYLEYMRRLEKITDMVVRGDPQPITGTDLTLLDLFMQVGFDTGMAEVNAALDVLILEIEERLQSGKGVLPKGAPKLACHFLPLNSPWVEKAFLENGVNLTVGRFFPPASWMEEMLDMDDIMTSVARIYLLCPDAVNLMDEVRYFEKILSTYKFDGALYGFFSNCRWIGALEKILVREVEQRTGIPHYYIEGDFWDNQDLLMENRAPIIRNICNSVKIYNI